MTTERITYRPENTDGSRARARTIYLTRITESRIAGSPVVLGEEVDRVGCPCDRLHVLQVSLIDARVQVVIDHKYGWYVPAGTATQETS